MQQPTHKPHPATVQTEKQPAAASAPKPAKLPPEEADFPETTETFFPDAKAAPTSLTMFEKQPWKHRNHPLFKAPNSINNWYHNTNQLWREKDQNRLVIPTKELHKEVMQACHDSVFSGHFGVQRTVNLCTNLFFWPNMTKHIKAYCESCKICQAIKSQTKAPFGQLRPPEDHCTTGTRSR